MRQQCNVKTTMRALSLVLGLSSTLLALSFATSTMAQEAASVGKAERKTQRVPTLRAKVYDQLSRAQTFADAGDSKQAFAVLDEVKGKASSMNSYELAMMYNFYGFINYNLEQFDQAIAAFEQVVQQQPIPTSFEQATLFSLAQLHMMRGNYDKTIVFIEKWETIQKEVTPAAEIPAKNLVLKAQAMYQKQDYAKASTYINQAVEQQENSKEGYQVDENWYVLQRAVYYELKQPEQVKNVLLKLVKQYEKPSYWIQLAGMYGELGDEKQQLAYMEIAYQLDYIATGSDIFNLSQLYYYHQMPFKAAMLMESAIKQGKLAEDQRNLTFLAQAWSFAKENDKAVPVMLAAAKLSKDGELDAQLAQIYLNLEQWEKAITASETALQKGGLRNEGTVHLVLGMAYFNVGDYNIALNQLSEAEKHNSSRGMAKQWLKFVQTEKSSNERLQAQLTPGSANSTYLR
jgi:tetratricopeptide (TPR) repeat protein